MNSIELRWLKIPYTTNIDGTKIVTDGYQKILQYRQKVSTTDYSKSNFKQDIVSKEVWGRWKDVPEVTD